MAEKSNLSGPRIKVAREVKGLTLDDLADLTEIKNLPLSREDLRAIEAQEKELCDFELIALANALEVSGSSLLFGKANEPL